ncbi:hypothetical protein SAMN04488000_109167 [Lentzea albida]|uniref:Uncharacterized protein n=1 Tax=Lentzea albida TaxID=65499 RepID=A0A1H9PN60_9PSEU|nr:hypothetical protein SAMN04488000_109167 [Lentzea albida]
METTNERKEVDQMLKTPDFGDEYGDQEVRCVGTGGYHDLGDYYGI